MWHLAYQKLHTSYTLHNIISKEVKMGKTCSTRRKITHAHSISVGKQKGEDNLRDIFVYKG